MDHWIFICATNNQEFEGEIYLNTDSNLPGHIFRYALGLHYNLLLIYTEEHHLLKLQ